MVVLNFVKEFFNLPALAGVIILTRHAKPFWQIVIGITLVILGLITR